MIVMTWLIGYVSRLDEPEFVETSLQCFVAWAKAKKMKKINR